MKSNIAIEKILSETYGYIERPFWFLISLLPPVLRVPVYKIIFAEFGKKVFIGENCHFRYPWKIYILDGASIGENCKIYSSFKVKNAKIVFGKNCMIAPNVTIYGAGHPIKDSASQHIGESVIFSENCYVGGSSIIRYGVKIGINSVIAAGSVVTKDVDDTTVVGGNPAKFIKRVE